MRLRITPTSTAPASPPSTWFQVAPASLRSLVPQSSIPATRRESMPRWSVAADSATEYDNTKAAASKVPSSSRARAWSTSRIVNAPPRARALIFRLDRFVKFRLSQNDRSLSMAMRVLMSERVNAPQRDHSPDVGTAFGETVMAGSLALRDLDTGLNGNTG